jgi:hypothetical protein
MPQASLASACAIKKFNLRIKYILIKFIVCPAKPDVITTFLERKFSYFMPCSSHHNILEPVLGRPSKRNQKDKRTLQRMLTSMRTAGAGDGVGITSDYQFSDSTVQCPFRCAINVLSLVVAFVTLDVGMARLICVHSLAQSSHVHVGAVTIRALRSHRIQHSPSMRN